MMALSTAKILLFLALNLGPQNPPMIYATTDSGGYVWSATKTGWDVTSLGFPSSDNDRNPTVEMSLAGDPTAGAIPFYLRAVSHHDWSHDSILIFDNGDRVEKHGDHGFYIKNAGCSNQAVYTILYPTESDPKFYVKAP